ncbi:hypothetical protein [Lactobacillus hominis]|uniref:hypothetical protein n=1 Tax=Lactobacillus hominis TaxID=1203033 RepID=UPI0023F22328|nr:hypothetical protein [Lactobacillus hominis]
MIKEIITSEGRFIKSLVGKKVNINDDYLYKQPEEGYSSDDRLYIPNEFVNAQFEIAGEIDNWYLITITSSFRPSYYWAKKADVKILGGVIRPLYLRLFSHLESEVVM